MRLLIGIYAYSYKFEANFDCEGAILGCSADDVLSLICMRLLLGIYAYAAGGYFFSAAKKSNQKTPFKGSPLKIRFRALP